MIKSAYIHIPFCTNICSYCDFPKVLYNEKWVSIYLDNLEKEIRMNYKNEKLSTLYIGGGTPSSLDFISLKRLFEIVSIFNFTDDFEITFEANSEDLTDELLLFLKDKVNRLSIGVQSFDEDILKLLNRKVNLDNIKNAKRYFTNINIDLMYDFNCSFSVLKKDLDTVIGLDIPHISTYSLILEKNTKLYIDNYKKK